MNSIRRKQLELKSEKHTRDSKSLFVKGRPLNRQSNCLYNQEYQGNNNNSRRNSKGKQRSKYRTGNKRCYGCSKTGHYIKDCVKKRRTEKKSVDERNVVEPLEERDIDVYVITNSTHNLNTVDFSENNYKNQEWIMDFGCTFHMTSRKSWIEKYKDINDGEVVMGNNVAAGL